MSPHSSDWMIQHLNIQYTPSGCDDVRYSHCVTVFNQSRSVSNVPCCLGNVASRPADFRRKKKPFHWPHLQTTPVRTSGSAWNFSIAQKVTAASVITATFYAAAAFLLVTKVETRPTLSQIPLSLLPHVLWDRVTPLADPQWPLSVKGSMPWVRKLARAMPISDSLQRWAIEGQAPRPVQGQQNYLIV